MLAGRPEENEARLPLVGLLLGVLLPEVDCGEAAGVVAGVAAGAADDPLVEAVWPPFDGVD